MVCSVCKCDRSTGPICGPCSLGAAQDPAHEFREYQKRGGYFRDADAALQRAPMKKTRPRRTQCRELALQGAKAIA